MGNVEGSESANDSLGERSLSTEIREAVTETPATPGLRSQSSSSTPCSPLSSPTKYLPSDGFKWRKYGHKFVKGSKTSRNYYKCTYPGCQMKKYVEKVEENGQFVDQISYHGTEHNHDGATLIPSPGKRKEDSNAETDSESESASAEQAMISSPTPTSRRSSFRPRDTQHTVIYDTADLESQDDGWSWRKYGQKQVKGATHSRNYYRCTEDKCPVRKKVEQKDDGTTVCVYEGQHGHLQPGMDDGMGGKRKRRRSTHTRTPLTEVADAADEACRKLVKEVSAVPAENTEGNSQDDINGENLQGDLDEKLVKEAAVIPSENTGENLQEDIDDDKLAKVVAAIPAENTGENLQEDPKAPESSTWPS
eukprot:TRINITY_DN8119_c0_g1_i1.p1 TRINITY_DN8119_c0_g1~~TRINITY_DN8119_c0_g1_i1.p1  ORF type:complete len:364 (-),score=90.65 TRINITY_DN8119_c0_g1_i1:79-1170(-)